MQILITIVLIVAAAIITYFVTKSKLASLLSANSDRYNELDKENAIINNSFEQTKTQLASVQKSFDDERNKVMKLATDLSEAKAINESLKEKLEKQASVLKTEFENLASKILEEKSSKFTEQNKTNLDIILNPLKEKLKDFEQRVEQVYKIESAERNTLKGEIKNLIDLNKQISDEANKLASALKGDSKQRGNWGELVLERILEVSGLIKQQEYVLQVASTNNEGERIIIDAVIYLPDEKHIIIDSKVSLNAYQLLVDCSDNAEIELHTKAHLLSVKNHIKSLSAKNYQTAQGIISPDFVLMFIPIESSFGIAVQADRDLFNYAWDRKVVIVSPSTLLATLRTIASIWKQERQTRNALEIAEEGGKLYDKFVGFVEDLIKVGKKMDGAKTDYIEAMKKLTDGPGNLVRRAEKMKELGAKANKSISAQLIERAE